MIIQSFLTIDSDLIDNDLFLKDIFVQNKNFQIFITSIYQIKFKKLKINILRNIDMKFTESDLLFDEI